MSPINTPYNKHPPLLQYPTIPKFLLGLNFSSSFSSVLVCIIIFITLDSLSPRSPWKTYIDLYYILIVPRLCIKPNPNLASVLIIMASAGTGTGSPCGACKFLRRKCAVDCIFAPYFCSEQGPARFAAIHKVFGASNVSKLLLHVPVADRCEAVVTIAYEAQARIRDPVHGCVAHIFALQQQVIITTKLYWPNWTILLSRKSRFQL